MKKVINGKLYDGETSTLIGSDSYSNLTDLYGWWEGVYRTKNGNYFLLGEGGPGSHYGHYVEGNAIGGGSDITPMSRQEAFEWLSEHECADEVIAEFPDMIKNA